MISRGMLNKLKDFGLNSYEAKIWAALLLKGTATAGSLSELAEVPRSRCYDVLETLEKKGFIMAKLGRPIKYLAVSPEEAVERVKTQLQRNTDEHLSLLDSLKTTTVMKELNGLHTSGMETVKPEELTGVIKHKRNINNHLITMMKATKQDILLAANAQELKEKVALITPLLQLKMKPKIRILTETQNGNVLKELRKIAEVKTVQSPGRFCITDHGAALFLTGDVDASSESALWINAKPVVENLRDLFEIKWANA